MASAALALGAAAASAEASSSEWHDSEGGKVRIVTTGKPDAQGKLQGVLEIALRPGWKTYWRDPGDSGVPPHIDVARSSNVTTAVLAYPAPQRHDDGYSKWAGYDHPVALPIAFTIGSPDEPVRIEADVLIGICETICIPLQARFSIDPDIGSDDRADAAVIMAALAGLPGAARPEFGITPLPGDEETMIVAATVPGNAASSDFFVAGEQGYMFGTPVKSTEAGKTIFTVPILDRPSEAPSGDGLFYTLTNAGEAVSGVLPYP
ncbi:protein-disulfide reductase DsbD domain-containing protein [Mesorhizobium sp. Root157]|uniref:protein-disulfide reductase DsbD domain-containing protein n=1 Tax=Mesorhizobium sp. Root157 TaxID=1736477 RepID=UPI001FCDC093|nr:protein-disulfide reductase DsbD domain-containing protein [Mesorhizobium sp. Root157]